MSERKVLNKYYPPDFDPSKIPRARCPRNRQFTVRLMVPCNIKCYTCGEYIAKGKKFNARKEDVENMTYLGVRIYRFYIKCPGCLAEISFRTDPESTDYVIEAGAHRNFQALKLAEEQAAREEREAKEEIESNPMLLLENRTQQSQYEMEVLESLEDLREMNDRHAGIDLGKMVEKIETERQLTQDQIEEMEKSEALKALGYEMVEGEMVKRINEEELAEPVAKKKKTQEDFSFTGTDTKVKTNMKSRLAGMIKPKMSNGNSKSSTKNTEKNPHATNSSVSSSESNNTTPNIERNLPMSSASSSVSSSEIKGAPQNTDIKESISNQSSSISSSDSINTTTQNTDTKKPGTTSENQAQKSTPTLSTGLLSLGAYSDSESDDSG